LGFIYADGYVGKYKLSVHLGERDFGHIQKLLLFLGSSSMTRCYSRGKAIGEVYSAYMSSRLSKLGIIVNRGRFDSTIVALSPEIYRHFIRGYVDGDGSLYLCNEKPSLKVIGQTDIIRWIDNTLLQNLGVNRHLMCRTKSEKVVTVTYNGRLQAVAIANFLYDNSSIYLDRKFEIYKSWKEIYSDGIAESAYHNCCPSL
jgi:hypothetical protein